MVTEHIGDLLKSGCDIICHQVNTFGVMGGGLAKQIATKYPDCENAYQAYCCNKDYGKLSTVFFWKNKDVVIANCFSQNQGFYTIYIYVEKCFKQVLEFAKKHNKKTIGVPKNYGCGIANGDWNKVEQIIKNVFENEKNIELQIWEKK